MPAPDPTAAYVARSATVRRNQEAALRRAWLSLGTWLGPGDYIELWLARAIPVMLGAQRASAALAVAHVNAVSGGSAAVPLDDFTGSALRGVDHVGTYQRGFSTVRKAVGKGVPFDDAVRRGLERQLDIAATDVQLARSRAAESSMRANGVKRFRRVLTGAENCGLCLAAASRVYRTGDLLSIHNNCDCGVAPITAANHDESMSALIDAEAAYAEAVELAGSTRQKDLSRVVAVEQHGELGPVLTYRGQHFKDAGQSHEGTPI